MSFEILYADPAWSYTDKATAGERGAAFKYPVMSVDDICALDVQAPMASTRSVPTAGRWKRRRRWGAFPVFVRSSTRSIVFWSGCSSSMCRE